MSELKVLFEKLWYDNISTYLNSGNVIFESEVKDVNTLKSQIEESTKSYFGFEIKVLVKTREDMQIISNYIPTSWENDELQKTDVAYLFPEIDDESILEKLPIKKEFLEIHYKPWVLFWNVKRKDQNASQLSKLAGDKLYKFMTVRNINTARFLSK